jgi:hypothetical protein
MLYFFKKKNLDKISASLSATFALPIGNKIEVAIGDIIDDKPTIYDDKIDSIYNATHIGGPNHRIFDGSHSPTAMWEKVKETLPDDTRLEELQNYFLSLIKDMQTVKGIPLTNINNKEAYEQAVAKMNYNFGISKNWFSDALTINLSEFFVTSVGVLAFVFKWKKREKAEFADLASSLLTAATVGANPFLFIVSLISLGASFTKDKRKKNFKKGALRGFFGMGSFFLAAGVFSSPLLGLIFGLCVALTVRRVLKKIPEKEIINWTKEQLKEHKKLIIGVGIGVGITALTGL